MTSETAPTPLQLRHITGFGRSIWPFLPIPLLLAALVFAWLNSSFTASQTAVAEQTMVVSGLGYSELPAAHDYHRDLLAGGMSAGDSAMVELQTPFGDHATAFVLRAETTARPQRADADVDVTEARGLVDEASTRLLDPSTLRGAAELFRSPSDVQSELARAEQALEESTRRLDAAREQRTRLLAADASPDRSEAASQDSWTAAAERDVMVRRVAELEIRADAESLTTPYQISSIGTPKMSVESGTSLGLLAGSFGAAMTAALATAAIGVHAITRRRITTISQARVVCSDTPVVDLTNEGQSDGLAHLSRLVSNEGSHIIELDMELDDGERSALQSTLRPLDHRGPGHNGAAVPPGLAAIVCIRLDSTTGSSVRRQVERLEDEALKPVALVCLASSPSGASIDEAESAASASTTGRLRLKSDVSQRTPILSSAAASIADDS